MSPSSGCYIYKKKSLLNKLFGRGEYELVLCAPTIKEAEEALDVLKEALPEKYDKKELHWTFYFECYGVETARGELKDVSS